MWWVKVCIARTYGNYIVHIISITDTLKVVLNEDMKLLLNENSYKKRNSNQQIEFDFVDEHIH